MIEFKRLNDNEFLPEMKERGYFIRGYEHRGDTINGLIVSLVDRIIQLEKETSDLRYRNLIK